MFQRLPSYMQDPYSALNQFSEQIYVILQKGIELNITQL